MLTKAKHDKLIYRRTKDGQTDPYVDFSNLQEEHKIIITLMIYVIYLYLHMTFTFDLRDLTLRPTSRKTYLTFTFDGDVLFLVLLGNCFLQVHQADGAHLWNGKASVAGQNE